MAGLPNSSNALQQWNHLFEAEGAKRSPQAQQHLQQLLRTGLPTRKHENWKYTPLDGLTNSQFVSIAGEIAPQQRDALALTLDAVRLVFVDGRYVPALSVLSALARDQSAGCPADDHLRLCCRTDGSTA